MWKSTPAAILIAILGGMNVATAADPTANGPQGPTTRPKSIFDPGLDPLPGSPGNSGQNPGVAPGQKNPVVARPGDGTGNAPAQPIIDLKEAGDAIHIDPEGAIAVDRPVTLPLHGTEGKHLAIEGDIYYRSDTHIYFHLRQISDIRAYTVYLSDRAANFEKWHHFTLDAAGNDIAVQVADEKTSHSGPMRTDGANSLILAPGARLRNWKIGVSTGEARPELSDVLPLPISVVPPAGPASAPADPAATVLPQIAGGKIPLAGTVAELIRNSAQVDSPNYEAEAIVHREGPREGWRTAPPIFQQTQAISYSHPKNNKNSGMAEFEVTRSGYLLLACNWNYQGNPSGGWVPTRLKQPDFIQRGWQPVDNAVFGGALSRFESKGDQVLFIKHVEKGEKYTLRCNKYYPPYAIVFR